MNAILDLAPVYTGTPDQILAQIVTDHQQRVTGFIASRLVRRDWQLAEDLTQDTFLHLWNYHISRSVPIDRRVFGLLTLIARQSICHHLRRMRSTEVAADFTDQDESQARTMTSSPVDVPHLAGLYEDLEAAKDVLEKAADTYRAANRRTVAARTGLGNSVRPGAAERAQARLESAGQVQAAALEAFAAAGRAVAQARTEWDTAAGELHGLGAAVAQMAGAR
ncbi:RNA polymerase sigma factor [Kitasatospora purpeofusca]|uniref:RNA polymerase sigma factor n=1 Tax=Kitasatospora purpeofusca TaxID=67352 RepID=UPI0037F23403